MTNSETHRVNQEDARVDLDRKCDPALWHAWLSSWKANGAMPTVEELVVDGVKVTCVRREPLPMVISDSGKMAFYGNGTGTYLVVKAEDSQLEGVILDHEGNNTGANLVNENIMASYRLMDRRNDKDIDGIMIVDQMLGIIENRATCIDSYRQMVGFNLDMTPNEHAGLLLGELQASLPA